MFELPDKSHALRLERHKNGNSRRAKKQGGPPLIIHRSNLTAQRPNDSTPSPMLRLKENRQKSALLGCAQDKKKKIKQIVLIFFLSIKLEDFYFRDSSYLHC